MTAFAMLVLIAALAGVAVAVQGQLMGAMDRTAGTLTSMFVTYGIGALAVAGVWLARRSPATQLRDVPWYSWTAGLFGLVIVGGIGYAAPRLGLSRTIVITIAAQLLTAMLIDRSLDVTRVIGLVLTAGGAWLIVR